jgi:hypothetical protein
MRNYDGLYTLLICSSQLLASNLHSDFNLRNKMIDFFCNPPYFYIPTLENSALPYTSIDLAQNLSDELWVASL